MDLEKNARIYAGIPEDSPQDLKYCVMDKKAKYDAFIAGANWQKAQNPSDDLPHWKRITIPNHDVTGFNSENFTYKGYYINYIELFEKLPKDD